MTRAFAGVTWRIAAGVVVWALHFTAVYAITAASCERLDGRALPVAVFIATGAALVASAVLAWREWRAAASFERWLALMLIGAAAIAIAWETIGAMVLPRC